MIDKPSSHSNDLLHSLTHEPDQRLDELARAVNGAAIEVHRCPGPGLQEPPYEPALEIELAIRSIPFQSEVVVPVSYKAIRLVIGESIC